MGAATDLLRRRAMMPQGDDYLKGWTFDVTMAYQHPERLTPWQGACVSPYYDIPDGCQVVLAKMSNSGKTQRWYICKEDGSLRDGQSTPVIGRLNVNALDKYVRIQAASSEIDDCYIQDGTSGKYIWKGKNVT